MLLATMAEKRVLPSGKVYRQMFDAQTQLSLALYDSRRKRVADEADCLLSGDAADSASPQFTGTYNISTRNAPHSGGKKRENQDDREEVYGLPDTVVPEKKNSDIIDRLMKKRQKDHNEAISELQADLSSLSVGFEPLFRQTGKDILLRLSENDDNIERLMQQIENKSDLTEHNYQDINEIWNRVCHESSLKNKWIKELDKIYAKYESERKDMIAAVLRKYTTKLEKISYLMPCDVHRLIDNEAMMINQALLANRRALAKLHLNLMEKHLQMDIFQRQRWEEKLEDWKTIKLNDAICRFKEFMKSPHIQNPKNIQDILKTLNSDQKSLIGKRIQILEIIRDMTPPRISKSSVVEWYSALSAVNREIDCIHIATLENLHKTYENNWQVCLAEVDLFKTEMSKCGFTSDETTSIVNVEILPLIGQCQSQTEVYLEQLDKAFENLTKTAASESQCLFKFMCGAAELWETHCEDLLNSEQHLQNSVESISQVHDQEKQRKEAHLDMMLDKLRQESTEEALNASLGKIITYLDEIKNGYNDIFKEEVETVECYPSVVLQKLQEYSLAVSQFFSVNEVYGQDSTDFCQLYPSLKLGQSIKANKNERFEKEPEDDQDIKKNLTFSFLQTKETLTTLKGNVYNCYGFHTSHDEEQKINLKETELVLYPKAHIVELLKDVRQTFFNHLEERFHIILTNTLTVMETRKEKLKGKHDLHIQLHQSRAVRIEMDIHNVRAAELFQHRERVARHCKGIQEVLENSQTELQDFQEKEQNSLIKNFQTHIQSREKDFTLATTSVKINELFTLLQTKMQKLISNIQTSQRDFRQKIEFRMEGLRNSNVQIMRSFKLFSEGGNFTPQEIEVFQSLLEKMDKCIDSAEGAIMQDMDEKESKCLEQVKNIFRKVEEKFTFHVADLKFREKMKQIFTNTQVQIKSEALKSNMQKKTIDSMLSHLKQKIAEYEKPSPDKKIVTVVEITSLITSLMEELKKRCQYLDCFLDASMAVPRPQTPLQGAFAVAARPRFLMQEKRDRTDGDSLLQPSRMGVPFLDDPVIGVIKGLLRVGNAKDFKEVNRDPKERPFQPGKSSRQSGIETLQRSVSSDGKRFFKPSRFDKFPFFDLKPEEQIESVPFKASINSIILEANRILLSMAEEFYKKKERRPITQSVQLQETFDQCAEEINNRIHIYERKANDYHNNCLQEFQMQLKAIEDFLSSVPGKLFSKLRDQYLKELKQSMTQIHNRFELAQQQSEQKRREHGDRLRVRLSHPACEKELKQLVEAEDDRLRRQSHAIQNTRQEVQACILKNAEEFVTALAKSAEALLFQFDNLVTIHEVHVEHSENITTLIRQTETSLLLEDKCRDLMQKGSRTWSGVSYFRSTDEQLQETATITTFKTTLGHLKTIETRDAMHELYGRSVQEELEKNQQECDAQERRQQQWQEHWQNQLKTLASFISE